MANDNETSTTSLEASVQKAKNHLENLKADAREANENNDLFCLRLFEELLKTASPIVTRAILRVEREQKAEISKSVKALAKEASNQRKAEREARNQAQDNA